MRVFTIAYADGQGYTIEADALTVGDHLTAVFYVDDEIVGLAQGWSTVTSEEGEAPIPTLAQQADLPELADPHDAFPVERAVVNPEPVSDPPVAPAAERTDLDHDIEELLVVPGARPEASAPDGQGVSTDPEGEKEPLVEDDVDANPPEPSPADSTDDDDPSTAGEDPDVAEMEMLGLKISEFFANHRKQQILVDFVAWAGGAGIPVQLGRMNLAQRRDVLAWFEEHKP